MAQKTTEPADFIVPLNINGLEGRMLRLPAKKRTKREFLFVYGSHSSLERWFGICLSLSNLGAVTMPDLPGLGGMTPLYKIGKDASIDNMADYLSAFIKLKYNNKKVIIVGLSLGFVIATRMLQKYPELAKNVTFLISYAGFVHHDDFVFSKSRTRFYKIAIIPFTYKIPALLFRYLALNPIIIRSVYHRTHNAKEKLSGLSEEDFKKMIAIEIELWHANDIRTQFIHYKEMFKLDNTKVPVRLPVHHIVVKNDRYFNNIRVEEHMRRVFNDFIAHYTKGTNHAPTVISTEKEGSVFIPTSLKRVITKKPSKG